MDSVIEKGTKAMLEAKFNEAIYYFTLYKVNKLIEENYNKLVCRVITVNAPNCRVFIERARAYYMLGQWEKAIEDCNAALAIEPNSADARCIKSIATYTLLGRRNLDLFRPR